MLAHDVVVATGYAREPFVPAWFGRDDFERPLLHAATYGNAKPFIRRDVFVVGCGCSGMEIAYDVITGGAARVRLAMRTAPNILLRSLGGLPGDVVGVAMLKLPPRVADAQQRIVRRLVPGDLSEYGLPPAAEGPFGRLVRTGTGPAVVDKEVIQSVKERRIAIVAGVEALDRTGARLADGTRIEPDAIVAATGYRCGLEPLVGHLDVLDEHGGPRIAGGGEAAPGLRFVGFVPVPGQIRRLGVEARRAARGIKHRQRLRLQGP